MNKRLVLKGVLLMMVVVIFSGCIAASIVMKIEPQTIEVEENQTDFEHVNIDFRVSGFQTLTIEKISWTVYDSEDEEAEPLEEDEISLNISIPFPGFAGWLGESELGEFEEEAVKPLRESLEKLAASETYKLELQGNTYTLLIAISGSSPTSDSVLIEFQ